MGASSMPQCWVRTKVYCSACGNPLYEVGQPERSCPTCYPEANAMKAKLYGPMNNYVGCVELPPTRAFPKVIYLDESPRGGQRLFVYSGSSDRYEEVTGEIPVVRLLGEDQ